MRKKIFVCDDDAVIITIIKFIFKDELIDIASTTDANAVMERVIEEQPDIILLDLMMPGANGYQVIAKLKENSQTEPIPVIVMSGIEKQDHIDGARHSGAVDYITKPFQPGGFRKTVMQHLSGDVEARDAAAE